MGYRGVMIDQVQSWLHDVDFITNGSDSTRYPSCPKQLGPRDRLTIMQSIFSPPVRPDLCHTKRIPTHCWAKNALHYRVRNRIKGQAAANELVSINRESALTPAQYRDLADVPAMASSPLGDKRHFQAYFRFDGDTVPIKCLRCRREYKH
jgi:hypothetical protein